MGIWAAQAGKDIYIEKPCSHNWWEGRQLVKAVNKYKVICEHGSQCRSSAAIREAMDKMQSGLLGDVYMARGLCYKWRDTIGHATPEPVPAGVHYDLWTGPAPLKPFTKNRFHYNWHWIWDTGNGDLGNQGIHEVDLARWGLGVTLPTKVTAIGGHFLFDDDQQTPNVLTVAYEFNTPGRKEEDDELRGARLDDEPRSGNRTSRIRRAAACRWQGSKSAGQRQEIAGRPRANHPRSAICITARKGYLAISDYDSYKSFLGSARGTGPLERDAPVKNEHFVNFIECVRSRRAEDLHAPILEGHLSSTLVHLANASYRLGRTINFDPQTESVVSDSEATDLLKGTYRAPYIVPEQV